MRTQVKNTEKTIDEIVENLIGKIQPVGETKEDERRYNSLCVWVQLTENMFDEIAEVAYFKNRHEGSMKKAGKKADSFIKYILAEYSEFLKD